MCTLFVETIFPPVFGRRLQAQVVKKGDRVIMEVEITGTPDPEVTWYKDDEPLISTEFAMKRQGNSYYLFIDKGTPRKWFTCKTFEFISNDDFLISSGKGTQWKIHGTSSERWWRGAEHCRLRSIRTHA